MASGSCAALNELPAHILSILAEARRGVLSTIGSDGSPHSVPVVYVVHDGELVSPIDDKPKRGPDLKHIANVTNDPRATLLADHWDEDWTRLGWVMVRGIMRVEAHNPTAEDLRDRYPQYTDEITPGERALVLRPRRVSWWTWAD
jgi:PPOX class probable F420-dependent enzyme